MARRKKENRLGNAFGQIGIVRTIVSLVLAIAGGWFSFTLAASGVTRTKNPQASLTMLAGESNALANRADQIYFTNPGNPSPSVVKLARRALLQQALNPKAIRLLGYVSDLRGNKTQALLKIELAAKLSRREAGAQIWLIEHYAQASDTVKTLKHYNILLTVKPDAQALLYPRLVNAIDDGPIRAALLPYMRENRAWMSGFLSHAIGDKKDISSLVNLIAEAKGFPKSDPGDETSRQQERSLIGRLVGEKRFDEAQRIYRLIPGAQAARLSNPVFDDRDRDAQYGAMGWQIPDDPNAGGGFAGKKGRGRPALSIFANSSTTQIVASRLLYLQPGNYRFSAQLSQLESGDGGYIRFQLRCPTSELASPAWTFAVDPKHATSSLKVPLGCPVQFLDIVASGGEGQLGMEATISSVAIMRQTSG
jgi:hypothetical protein